MLLLPFVAVSAVQSGNRHKRRQAAPGGANRGGGGANRGGGGAKVV